MARLYNRAIMSPESNGGLDVSRIRPRLVLVARAAALVCAVFVLTFAFLTGELELVIWAAVLYLPYLAFTVMPTSAKSLALGRSLPLFTGTLTLGLSALFLSGEGLRAEAWPMLASGGFLIAVQAAQLVLAYRAYPLRVPMSRTLLAGSVYYLLATGFIWWGVSSISDTSPLPYNESHAIGSLRTINTAAVTYSLSHEETGFPPDLAALGPVLTDKRGYVFEYQAENREGKIVHYSVTARPVKYGETGFRSFLTDDSGVIRFTGENRPATPNDPPV
jgi:hypothetical protein